MTEQNQDCKIEQKDNQEEQPQPTQQMVEALKPEQIRHIIENDKATRRKLCLEAVDLAIKQYNCKMYGVIRLVGNGTSSFAEIVIEAM